MSNTVPFGPGVERETGGVLPPDVLEALLAAIAPVALQTQRAEQLKARILSQVGATEQLLANTVTVYADGGEWTQVAPGVNIKKLHKDMASRSFLLRLDAGAAIPKHGHEADEECMVMSGEVRMGEMILRAGDYHLARPGSSHAEIVSPTGALLFFHVRHSEGIDRPAAGA
jgi:anti-sigma factor ChrR (cupin superfamily)